MRLQLVLSAVLALLLPSSADVDVPVTQHWSGGFQGEACFDITKELHGWTLTLHFDQPINTVDVWVAEPSGTSDGGQTFVFKNKEFNGDAHVGDKLCIQFQGHADGDVTPKITASLAELSNGGGTVTTAPHTQAPVTQAPTRTTTKSTTTRRTSTTTRRTTTTPRPTTTRPTGPTTPKPVVAPTGDGILADLKVLEDWGGRFDAEVVFTLPDNFNGWKATFSFSDPIDEMAVSLGEVSGHTADKKTWTVVSTPHDSQFDANDDLAIQFYGDYYYDGTAPSGKVLLSSGSG